MSLKGDLKKGLKSRGLELEDGGWKGGVRSIMSLDTCVTNMTDNSVY